MSASSDALTDTSPLSGISQSSSLAPRSPCKFDKASKCSLGKHAGGERLRPSVATEPLFSVHFAHKPRSNGFVINGMSAKAIMIRSAPARLANFTPIRKLADCAAKAPSTGRQVNWSSSDAVSKSETTAISWSGENSRKTSATCAIKGRPRNIAISLFEFPKRFDLPAARRITAVFTRLFQTLPCPRSQPIPILRA